MIPELDQLLDLSWITKPSGIYFLLLRGDVQYVGKSLNVAARVSAHRNNLVRKRKGLPPKIGDMSPVVPFDGVRVLLAERDTLDALEIKWIQQLNPPYNTQLNRAAKFDLKAHGFFQDLITLGAVRQQKAKEAARLLPVTSLYTTSRDRGLHRIALLRGTGPKVHRHA